MSTVSEKITIRDEVNNQATNQHVPDWNLEDDFKHLGDILLMANQKKPMGSDSEFVELLWQDGHVVMHSQNHREASAISSELKPVQEPEPAQQCEQSLASSPNLIPDDETVSWFQYPLDDPLEKEFCLGFFSEMAGIDATGPDKMSNNGIAEDEGYVKFGVTNETNVFAASAPCRSTLHAQEKAMTPKPQGCKRQASFLDNSNFSQFSRSVKADFESLRSKLVVKASRSGTKVGGQENSMLTDGSSICGSNRIHRLADLSSDGSGVAGEPNEHAMIWFPSESVQKHVCETTHASTSGGSDCSVRRIGEQGESNQSQKRKRRDEDLEYQSEEAEYESAEAKKQQSTSTRRSRAAEVHNLSERRRRDRINEKMKALQELIPRCNKTDKASMLDEAIEYLKSLQLQVQMMWMGSGMAQMMFPGAQQYMSGIGMGMDHASVPLMHHAVHLPGVPVISQSVGSSSTTNQTLLCPSQAIHAVNFRDQMQSFHLQESYAPFLGFHHVQPHSQAMNLCNHGSHVVQQNQPTVTTSSSILSCAGQTSFENSHNSKSG